MYGGFLVHNASNNTPRVKLCNIPVAYIQVVNFFHFNFFAQNNVVR